LLAVVAVEGKSPCCSRRRSIACASCSCSFAIFVKPFFRKLFARARCHSGARPRSTSRASAAGQSAAAAGVPVDAEHTRRMNRQTYRRQERENRNEHSAGKRHDYSGGCFDYTAEAIEPSYRV